MSVAVPTGEYAVECSLDLTPLFDVVRHTETVEVVLPGPNLLDERLSQLDSEDGNVRYRAVLDLRYFTTEGARVVPALLQSLKDPEMRVRNVALTAFYRFPKEAAEHIDVFLGILQGNVSIGEKANAAYVLGRFAPVDAKYEKALVSAKAAAEDNYKPRFSSALTAYRRRADPPAR